MGSVLHAPMCPRNPGWQSVEIRFVEQVLDCLTLSPGEPVAHRGNDGGMLGDPSAWSGTRLLELAVCIEAKNGRIAEADGCGLEQLGERHELGDIAVCIPTRQCAWKHSPHEKRHGI